MLGIVTRNVIGQPARYFFCLMTSSIGKNQAVGPRVKIFTNEYMCKFLDQVGQDGIKIDNYLSLAVQTFCNVMYDGQNNDKIETFSRQKRDSKVTMVSSDKKNRTYVLRCFSFAHFSLSFAHFDSLICARFRISFAHFFHTSLKLIRVLKAVESPYS